MNLFGCVCMCGMRPAHFGDSKSNAGSVLCSACRRRDHETINIVLALHMLSWYNDQLLAIGLRPAVRGNITSSPMKMPQVLLTVSRSLRPAV